MQGSIKDTVKHLWKCSYIPKSFSLSGNRNRAVAKINWKHSPSSGDKKKMLWDLWQNSHKSDGDLDYYLSGNHPYKQIWKRINAMINEFWS